MDVFLVFGGLFLSQKPKEHLWGRVFGLWWLPVRGTPPASASASAPASTPGSPLNIAPTTSDPPLLPTRLPLVPHWHAT